MNIPEIMQSAHPTVRKDGAVDAARRNKPPGAEEASEATAVRESSTRTSSKEAVETVVAEVENQFNANDINLKFKVLEDSNAIQVEVQDAEGKTIRKIPGDDLIKLSESLKNLERGFLDQAS